MAVSGGGCKTGTEAQFHDVLFDAADAMRLIVAYRDGTLLRANPPAQRFFGVSEEPLGLTLYGLSTLPTEELRSHLLAAGRAPTSFRQEHQPDAQGRPRSLTVHCQPLGQEASSTAGRYATTEPTVLMTLHDVTETERVRDGLERDVRRLRSILANVENIAIQGYGEDRKVIYWNKASEEVYGYTEAEALGRNLEDLIIPDEMREEVVRLVTAWCAGGPAIPTGELLLVGKGGRRVPVLSSHVLCDAGEGVKELYCIDVDLAPFKALEAELTGARIRAETANKAKDTFLATMSHELRTPLNGLLGMLQLLQLSRLEPEQQEYVATAMRVGGRLTELLGDILDLARIESGRVVLNHETFTPGELLTSVTETFGAEHAGGQVRLYVSCHGALPLRMVGDILRLRQVLFNLVGNALKFTYQGEVRVELTHLDHPAVAVPPREAAFGPRTVRLLLAVHDTGAGIAEEDLELIFLPFQQAEEGMSRKHQGAGLGLSIVRRLVALMGGTMALESEPGQGTSVYVALPLGLPAEDSRTGHEQIPPPVRARTVRPEPATPPRTGATVLLVEDDGVNRMAARRLLERFGYTVLSAKNGREALEMLQGTPPGEVDVVLMDVSMPVMDGLEATRCIRSGVCGPEHARLPIVALTAHAMRGDGERLLAKGMSGYLAKPVDVKELLVLLHDLLAGAPDGDNAP